MPAENATSARHLPEDQEEILRRMRYAVNYNAWLLERARPYLGDRVLDAGAGTGTFTEMLADKCDFVVALEPEDAFAAQLEERFAGRPNVTILRLDLGKLRPEAVSSPVDSIVCFNVLEHIRDDEAALVRFADVTALGGHVLILVPAHPRLFGSIDRTVGHERRYGKADLRSLLCKSGFEIVDLRFVNPLGALGWLVSARILRRKYIPEGSLRIFDRLVPFLRALDRFDLRFGLSLWAVGRRAGRWRS